MAALRELERVAYIEKMNPKFTATVHGASLNYVLEELVERDHSPANIENQILRTYQDEMKLRPDAGLSLVRTSQGFDRLSYSIFKTFYTKLDPSDIKKVDITRKIGRKIFESFNFDVSVRSDYSNLVFLLNTICKLFTEYGYYTQAKILTTVQDLSGELYQFSQNDLREGKLTHFGYFMENAVIHPSASQLFLEHGEAQHFSSRTIQAFFEKNGLKGREVDFNPTEHPPEAVVELWEVQKT